MTTLNITRTFNVTVGPIGGEDDYDVEVLMEISVEDGEAYLASAYAHHDQVEKHTQLWHKCEEWVDDNMADILDQAIWDKFDALVDHLHERRAVH